MVLNPSFISHSMCLLNLHHIFYSSYLSLFFLSDFWKANLTSKLTNGNYQKVIATWALNGQAGLTLQRIKAAAKSHTNRRADSSKSELKREREIQIKNTLGESKCLNVQVYSSEWIALHHLKLLTQIASFAALHILTRHHLCHMLCSIPLQCFLGLWYQ